MKRFRYILALMLAGNIAGHAHAVEHLSVAPFKGQASGKHALSLELTQELVQACLSANDEIAVLERADLTPMMAEKSRRIAGMSPSAADQKLKGVRYLVTGSVTDIDGKWLLSLQANDVASTQIIASHSATVDSHHLAMDICNNAVAPLIKKLLHQPARIAANTPIESTDESRDSTLLLQGIGYVNNGAYAKSFPLFLKILNHNPRHADAKYWLTMSYAKAGLIEFAQKESEEFIAEFPNDPRSNELKTIASPPAKKE